MLITDIVFQKYICNRQKDIVKTHYIHYLNSKYDFFYKIMEMTYHCKCDNFPPEFFKCKYKPKNIQTSFNDEPFYVLIIKTPK